MSGDVAHAPEFLQPTHGPPWASEPDGIARSRNRDLLQAVSLVVQNQHAFRVDRNTLLEMLRRLAEGRVDYAKELVASGVDGGGAHTKMAYLRNTFGEQVLTEVHDLLVQPRRADQVRLVLRLLEAQYMQRPAADAMMQWCRGTAGPPCVRVTEVGSILWHVLEQAPVPVRSAGYTAHVEQMDGPSRGPVIALDEMRGQRVSSSSEDHGPASDDTSSHGSPGSVTSNKRHVRSGGPAAGGEDVSQGASVAGGSDL